MSTFEHLSTRICVNCKGECQPDDLYCVKCGYILLDSLDEGASQTLDFGKNQSQYLDLQWGTGYFHHRARLYLRVMDTDQTITVPLTNRTPLVLGRSSDSSSPDLDLTPFGAVDYGVSRRHAQIMRLDDQLEVMDLNSANGTFLNRNRLAPNLPVVLRNRAALQLGKLILRVQFV